MFLIYNMSRREKAEIIKDILELCRSPVGKTKIVYQCNLNFKIVKKYLTWCFSKGWLERIDNTYITTELGKSKLDILRETTSMIRF